MEKVAEANGSSNYEFAYMRKPESRTRMQKFKLCLHDPSDGSFLGRTPKSWGQLLLFYAIFYIVLAALFTICMKGLLATLHDDEPKWKLDSSRIGSNPGLGFRPISKRTEEGSLIWFDRAAPAESEKWADLLDEFLAPYAKGSGRGSRKPCDFSDNSTDSCRMSIDETFGECTPETKYGYDATGSPCIFLKLNRIYGWQPEFYDDPDDLPADMPADLVAYISTADPAERQQIWVSCQGENPADRESLTGGIIYVPTRGFPNKFYPFTNQKDYQSPLVAVQFLKPREKVLINIECRAWAKNVDYFGGNRDRKGSVHFELLVD